MFSYVDFLRLTLAFTSDLLRGFEATEWGTPSFFALPRDWSVPSRLRLLIEVSCESGKMREPLAGRERGLGLSAAGHLRMGAVLGAYPATVGFTVRGPIMTSDMFGLGFADLGAFSSIDELADWNSLPFAPAILVVLVFDFAVSSFALV